MKKKLFIVFISTFILMSGYELSKQLIFPGISIWESHVITIFFTSVIAVLIVYFPLRSLYLKQEDIIGEVEKRKKAEESVKKTNKKLKMLSSVTRHDILNNLTVLIGYHELARELSPKDPELQAYLEKETECIEGILKQVRFTQYYEEIGVHNAGWYDVHEYVARAASQLVLEDISLDLPTDHLEIFADPLIEKVFYNLMENSIRHGGGISAMKFHWAESEGSLDILYEDDGKGIPAPDKEQIFTKGFGKHTGFGLFLTREILAITGITILENGIEGHGVRFIITVPKDGYRFSGRTGNNSTD